MANHNACVAVGRASGATALQLCAAPIQLRLGPPSTNRKRGSAFSRFRRVTNCVAAIQCFWRWVGLPRWVWAFGGALNSQHCSFARSDPPPFLITPLSAASIVFSPVCPFDTESDTRRIFFANRAKNVVPSECKNLSWGTEFSTLCAMSETV
jgi:hypothetical protein